MTSIALALLLAQWNTPTSTNVTPIESRANGAKLSNTRQYGIDCRTNLTCTVDGGWLFMSASGGAGGSGPPVDAGYVVWGANSSGSSNERALAAGNYTTINTGTAGQVKTDWAHGLTCSAGQAFTSSGTSALACTSTITASDVSCAGTCVADAEISGVSGAKVSGAVSSSSALAANPADCTAGQYATTIAANGDLTCAQVAFSQVSGTVTNGQLASSYSGVGACGANTWASTLNANAAPTCTQPAFSSLTGSASIAQGGTGVSARAANDVVIGTGANTTATKTLPSCSNATTSKLLFDNATQTFSCGTDQNSGGSGSANVVEASIALTGDGAYFSQVVTGQTWVTASSKIVCSVFATSADGLTVEAVTLGNLNVTVSDLVASTGFTLNVFSPNGLDGTIRVHCTGA